MIPQPGQSLPSKAGMPQTLLVLVKGKSEKESIPQRNSRAKTRLEYFASISRDFFWSLDFGMSALDSDS